MPSDLFPNGGNCTDIRGETICHNNITLIFFDGNVRNISDCTVDTCSLLLANFEYLPNIGGNVFFVLAFAAFMIANIGLGLWKRTWGVFVGMSVGCLFEMLGYIGRVMAHNQPFEFNPFLIYIIFLTIGPALLSAAIYLCLARIIVVYGKENARLKPRVYSIIFMVSDFIALVLQGAGGGIAATAAGNDASTAQSGINIMIAGLAWQVISLTIFAVAAADFAWCVKRRGFSEPAFLYLRQSTKFRNFLWALGVATVAIYARSIYRVAELSQGFDGKIANEEVPFMIFEPVMITIACICVTAWHPSIVFGDAWHAVSNGTRIGKKGANLELGSMGDEGYATSKSSTQGLAPGAYKPT